MPSIPILYSFRRCPYAIRARLALAFSNIEYELREVDLKAKPDSMLKFSPKGTVPVLVLPDNKVIDESYDIVNWAFDIKYPTEFAPVTNEIMEETKKVFSSLHESFIFHLNRYKYPDRYDNVDIEHHKEELEKFLLRCEKHLSQHKFLLADKPTAIDILVFPFVRQLDIANDKILSGRLRSWFDLWLEHELFQEVMQKKSIFKD